MHQSNQYGSEVPVYASIKSICINQINVDQKYQYAYASIDPVPQVGRMLYNNALPRNLTLALISCTHKYLRVKSRRHASLCHTPRKSRPRPILTSLTCACHSQTWTKMYVSVVCDFCVCMSKQLHVREKACSVCFRCCCCCE